jgi:hypothetical protein
LTNCYQLSKMDKVSFFYKEEKHLVMPHTRWPLSSFMWAESIHSCFSSSENYLALCLNIFLLRDQFLYLFKLWKMNVLWLCNMKYIYIYIYIWKHKKDSRWRKVMIINAFELCLAGMSFQMMVQLSQMILHHRLFRHILISALSLW